MSTSTETTAAQSNGSTALPTLHAFDANDNPNAPHLQRALTLFDAAALVVGSMIGSGIFLTSAESARLTGAPGWLLLAWLLAGVLTITGALSYGELAAMMPRAGGPYVFLKTAYTDGVGFLYGWSQFLIIQTGTIAAVAIAFANFAGVFLPAVSNTNHLITPMLFGRYAITFSTQQLLAIFIILILTFINMRGLREGKWIQNTFTVAKTLALLLVVVIGLVFGWNNGGALFSSALWASAANGWTSQAAQPGFEIAGALGFIMIFLRAMIGPLFSQSAWDNVTFAAGEVQDPGKNLPRALLAGCIIVVSLYLLANLAYVVTLPLAEIQNAPQGRVAAWMMNRIFGATGALVMAAAIMVSTFGCLNGLILSGARVSYAMAQDNLFFRALSQLNRQRVPAFALAAQGVWATLLVLPRTVASRDAAGAPQFGNVYTQLLEYIVSVDLLFGALAVLAVFVLRRRAPDLARPYRTWGYPVVPAIFLLLSALLIVNLAFIAPDTARVGYLLALTGVPVYLVWRWLRARRGGRWQNGA